MHKMLIGFAAAAILASGALPASAQTEEASQTRRPATTQRRAPAQPRTPAPGMWAVGGSIGATTPSDPALQNGIDLTGNIERYLTSRLSLRGQTGVTWWDIQGHSFPGTITPFFADFNAVYNWEGGVVHPFVTGGVGVYHFSASEPTIVNRSDTKPGFDLGGGLDYFINRRTTMGGELTYHHIDGFDSPLARFPEGSFWRFGFGLKRLF